MQCEGRKKDGSPCKARPLVGAKYCAFHQDPNRAVELGRRGGHRRTIYDPDQLKEFGAPQSAADLRDLLAQSIIEIRTGKMDPRLANSVAYLGCEFLRALEISDIERRLRVLEEHQEAAEKAKSESEPEPTNNVYALLAAKLESQQERNETSVEQAQVPKEPSHEDNATPEEAGEIRFEVC